MTRALLFAVFLALISGPAAWGQINRLVSGRLATTILPEVLSPTVFNGADGFFLDVPESAERVVFSLTTAPRESNVDLFVRFGQDVVQMADGTILADYSSRGPTGAERIEINLQSSPPLMTGRYFVAFLAGFRNPQTFAFLQPRVDLVVGSPDVIEIAFTDFETGDPQGWSRNFPEPELMIPGSTLGGPTSVLRTVRLSGGNDRVLEIGDTGNDYFVASNGFLGNLHLLGSDARLEFDLRYLASDFPGQVVDVRLLGEQTTFRWSGDKPGQDFQRYIVPIRENAWERLSGPKSWEEVLRNVQRIEIRANYSVATGRTQIDNVTLLGRPRLVEAPIVSHFDTDGDGWRKNIPEAPFLIPRYPGVTTGDSRSRFRHQATDGNPRGFLRLDDIEDLNRDYLVAPEKFLGDWSKFNPGATFEFDRRHVSIGGATRTVEVRLFGIGGVYRFTAPPPGPSWTRYAAPLDASQWMRLAGNKSFEEVLRVVQRIEVSMDEVSGFEEAGLDNVTLVNPPLQMPQLSAAPTAVSFTWVQGDPAPPGQAIELTTNGPGIEWIAGASAGAPWIRPNPERGEAPGMLVIEIDPAGLARGVHEGFVEIAWPDAEQPMRIAVSLTVLFPTTPRFSRGGVVNAADFTANTEPGGELTGGMFVAFFGQELAGQVAAAASVPFPTELDGARISMDGVPVPLVFVSPLQAVGVVPQQLVGGTAAVIVSRNGDASPAETVRFSAVRPKLFSQNQTGRGPGAIQNFIGGGQVQLNTFDNPARPGQQVVIFGTGFGPTQTPVPDGHPATAANAVTGNVRVTVGGIEAAVSYAGLSPGSPHLYQANATIAPGSPLGCEVPVRLAINDFESNEVTMAVTGSAEPCR